MIEIKFTGATMRDVLDQIRDLVTYEEALPEYDVVGFARTRSGASLPAHPEQPPAPADKPKRERKKAKAPAAMPAATPTEHTAKPTISEATPQSAPAASAPKLADAQAALTKFFEKNGLGPSRELLQQFGVGKVQELKPEQFADFIAKAAV